MVLCSFRASKFRMSSMSFILCPCRVWRRLKFVSKPESEEDRNAAVTSNGGEW
jgi:hypothetical protein